MVGGVSTRRWRVAYEDTVEALVGPGARRALGGAAAPLGPDLVALVYDEGVPGGLVEDVASGLAGAGLRVVRLGLPGGEAVKTLDTVARLWRWLLEVEATRASLVVAVGGGAVTDTVGFAAATYMRGVRWATVPTTLLGMADAAVGGKTAVNLEAKNIVGAFHQPRFIVADVEYAATLPEREYRSGLAEVAKHALIRGGGMLERLKTLSGRLLGRDPEALTWAVLESIDVKMGVVSRDPREETGLRSILNLGHTYAHALEKASGYSIPHGYAVSIGLVVEAYAAVEAVGADPGLPGLVAGLLEGLGLPVRPPREPGCGEVVEHVRLDKKRRGDRLLLPLLREPGRVELVEMGLGEARRLLMEACARASSGAPALK
ncbi:MAG: 3-dehydroquinate synthase [Crenarchaeota archaeon]|nr:3-dehydroquinate synthase [Thermoproteota archaeon]